MTDDDKALVERLREGVLYGDARLHNPKGHDPLRMEAADRIEALSAEDERIKDRLGWICAVMDLDDEVTLQWIYAELEALRGLGDTK